MNNLWSPESVEILPLKQCDKIPGFLYSKQMLMTSAAESRERMKWREEKEGKGRLNFEWNALLQNSCRIIS